MQCPECAAENREGVRFCEDCGARLDLKCPSCGAELIPGKRFCGACGATLGGGEPARAAAPPEERPAAYREERRWATVLFADLAGFTSLAERMDPEDVKALAHRCAERLGEEVRRFGGTVVNVMGDAVLAVFGPPVAHEDDAERAVRAGLAIRDCPLPRPGAASESPIQVHVGINTGEVMAGLVGPEGRRDYTVMGDAVNTAARLMAAALPGTILVGEETYRATRERVRYREIAPVEAKGKERPVAAWQALEAVPLPRARPLGTAPLVGRDEELALLSGIWTKVAREARPHLVTVLGEPGIGKSRLVAEFERRARTLDNAVVLHGRCLPYGEALGYGALAMALREAAGITPEDDAEAARAKLGDLVAGALGPRATEGDAHEIAHHLALLGGLDTAADRSAAGADERTLRVSTRRFLEALARRRPLCLLLEDIHWADDALLGLIEFVAARAQAVPLLIVTQARPELLEKRPTWGGGVRAFTSLPLEPLDGRAGRDLVIALCGERGLSEEVAERVGRGAGGNPLFAEELIATIAEGREAAGVPSAIKALISARLDSLPPEERWAIQRAAVFGKHFWPGGLAALGADGDVGEHLDALEARDLLRAQPQSRFRGDREYAFKHDLIRDVAYEMLPRAERRALHGRVADWVERAAGERAEELLDLLAHHAVQAEQHDRALGYLIGAAERARRAAAHREQAGLLAQAIAIAERSGRGDRIAELRAKRGKAFASVGLWEDATQELEAALTSLAPEQQEQRAEVLVNLSLVRFWSIDTAGFRRHASEALPLARAAGRDDLVTEAMAWLAAAEGAEGRLDAAIDQYRRTIERAGELRMPSPALSIYQSTLYWTGQFDEGIERGREVVRLARGGHDIDQTMLALQGLGLALAGSGRYDEAALVFDEARQLGREYGVGPFLARSIAVSAGFHLDVFDLAGHEAVAEEARELARSVNFPPALVSASIDLLLNFARRGEASRAEQLVDEVAATVEKAAGWHGWLWRLRLAEARAEIALARGDWEETIRLADDAVERSRGKRVKYQALALGTRAQALDRLGRGKEAIADLGRAVELARPVGDPALFLRTAAALLALDGSDVLATEARAAAERIAGSLPGDEMRRCFGSSEPVSIIHRLTA